MVWPILVSAVLPRAGVAQEMNQSAETSVTSPLSLYLGLQVRQVQVRGVGTADEARLRGLLAQKTNMPLDRVKCRESMQALYDTGRFSEIQLEVERAGDDGVELAFVTRPNYFVGDITVEGAPGRPTENQIVNASKLQLGEQLTDEKLERGKKRIQELMEENGYYRSKIEFRTQPNPVTQQTDIVITITAGERARTGAVNVSGSSGYSDEEVRSIAGMHAGDEVSADRLTHALQKLRKKYQKKDRLLAQVTAERKYRPEKNLVDYTLHFDPGPAVQIAVEGFHMRRGLIKKYVPVYEENALDDDLLNEGRRNLLDYLQTRGFFEAKVGIKKESPNKDLLRVVYVVTTGSRHKLVRIAIVGNKYFADDLLRARIQIQPAGRLLSFGRYSQSLLNSDIKGLTELYRANGFADIKITSEVTDNYEGQANQIAVRLKVQEGTQILVGALHIVGNQSRSEQDLLPLLSTVPGQPFSDFNVSGDRDTLLNDYFNHGFPDATFDASAKPSEGQPNHMDVTFTIKEGEQVFVDRVYVSGLNFTRPFVVQQQLQIHPGEPVSQVGMLDTQRRLYDLGIFNQVDTAIQNPQGKEPDKNILVSVREAKRYTFNYGLGLEVQTGTGANVPQGRTGVSPRVSFDVTRLNFRGRDHTISFKSHVGRLQQRGLLSYDAPRWFNRDNLRLTFSAFYDNTLDVNTFTSRRAQGTVEAEQVLDKATKMYYRFSYRRVQATNFASNFNKNEAPLLSQPTRVGMPGISFIRDNRDNPLESTKGNYNTIDAGVASSYFGSQADFSRVLFQNSTYYQFKKRKYVFARSTRVGLETPFHHTVILTPADSAALSSSCRNATEPTFGCPREIPLPERFFSGGGNSLRGFGLNQAGPRDLVSGFPVGGGALFINNLELRLPPPTLPFFQDNLSFAFFHDAGNVFDSGHEMIHSLARWQQKNPELCLQDTTAAQCDFNYVSQAVGVGVRYKTPLGPVRFDFGYNLNPPAFPSCQASPVFTAQAPSNFCVKNSDPTNPSNFFNPKHLGRLNVYFSIGQTF